MRLMNICNSWMYATHEHIQVMSHILTSHVTNMCGVMSHALMSHVTHICESWRIYWWWVTSHIYASHVTYIDESRHTHIHASLAAYIDKSRHTESHVSHARRDSLPFSHVTWLITFLMSSAVSVELRPLEALRPNTCSWDPSCQKNSPLSYQKSPVLRERHTHSTCPL